MNTLATTHPEPTEKARLPYCHSRLQTRRRLSRPVPVGNVVIGGHHPVVVQSMTTTNTEDVAATVRQTIELAEAGCEVVRITAPTTRAARCLGEIRKQVSAAGFDVPLVADIHFAPKAAMEAAEHVEKVRINPGNYADRKKFAVREYSDNEYESELQRLYEEFSPIVLKCKQLGRAMRIGTNHGSLSDRIMNRFGDTPEGMVQSALEFIRIAESHGYYDIILSMKASNPKVMIQAYRLAVARMLEEDMHYPLHLGVTEAGDGEDARVKSAIGIGALLYDGLGDTIRVSLTEDPVHEIPFGKELARRTTALWSHPPTRLDPGKVVADEINPYEFTRRDLAPIFLRPVSSSSSGGDFISPASRSFATEPSADLPSPVPYTGAQEPPRVVVPTRRPVSEWERIAADAHAVQKRFRDARIEGLLLTVSDSDSSSDLRALSAALRNTVDFLVIEGAWNPHLAEAAREGGSPVVWSTAVPSDPDAIRHFLEQAREASVLPACDLHGIESASEASLERIAATFDQPGVVVSVLPTGNHDALHPLGACRRLAACLRTAPHPPILWIRNREAAAIFSEAWFTSRLTESSILTGTLLCDGLGEWVSVETEPDIARATALAYNILQGARARVTKTEYVACPSCGRTLFDLQSTTQRIRARTNHLKGVTIAVMGCIVNGPGEMADADFGYVGGAPGKVNLYVGKNCVTTGIPEAEAVDRLIDLIREHGKWTDPAPEE